MTTTDQPRSGFGLEQARAIASSAHAGHVDKSGGPYIGHVERVVARVAAHGPEAAMAAWLHDVVEDSGLTLADLGEAGVPPRVLAAGDALTKRPGEPYPDAVRRAASDPLPRLVTLADNADDADEGPRRPGPRPAGQAATEVRRSKGRATPEYIGVGIRPLCTQDGWDGPVRAARRVAQTAPGRSVMSSQTNR